MNFTKRSITQYILYDTGVENIFISEFMPKAPELCVKAYLLGLMYAQMGRPAEDGEIAKSLGITVRELYDCWRYWEEEGIISAEITEEGSRIEFLNLKEQAFGSSQEDEVSAAAANDAEVKKLYSRIEELTGSISFKPKDLEEIRSWIESYGFSADFVIECYKYRKKRGLSLKTSGVSWQLREWKAKGIDSLEALAGHLEMADRHAGLYRKVLKSLNVKGDPTEPQMEMMDVWIDEWDFSEDRIMEACKKTVNARNPSIAYINSVLKAWYEEEHAAKTESESSQDRELSLSEKFAKVEELYARDREENKKKTEEARARLYAETPRLKELSDEYRDASYRLSRTLFAGGSTRIAAQKKRIEEITQERAQILESHGYEKTALDRIYTCSRCKDTGELEDGMRCPCFNEKLSFVTSGFEG